MSQELLDSEQAIQELLLQLKELQSATAIIGQAREAVDRSTRAADITKQAADKQIAAAIELADKAISSVQNASEVSSRLFESVTRQGVALAEISNTTKQQMIETQNAVKIATEYLRNELATKIEQTDRATRRNSWFLAVICVLQLVLVGLYAWVYQAWLFQTGAGL